MYCFGAVCAVAYGPEEGPGQVDHPHDIVLQWELPEWNELSVGPHLEIAEANLLVGFASPEVCQQDVERFASKGGYRDRDYPAESGATLADPAAYLAVFLVALVEEAGEQNEIVA